MTAGLVGAVCLHVAGMATVVAGSTLKKCWFSLDGLVEDACLTLLDENTCGGNSGFVDEGLLTQNVPFLLAARVEDISGLRASERTDLLAEARNVSVCRGQRGGQ